MMVSSHYPMLYSHPQTWLVVALIIVIGGAVRHFLNRHDAGDPLGEDRLDAAGGGGRRSASRDLPDRAARRPGVAGLSVSDGEVLDIVGKHCVMCHSARPEPRGLRRAAEGRGPRHRSTISAATHDQILAQAVNGDAMPLGNETGMTAEERQKLGAWLASQ